MPQRKEVPGRVEIHRTRSRKPENQGKVWIRARACGNLRILHHTEQLTSKRLAINNIVATARLYNGTPPEIWDCTGPEPVLVDVSRYART